MIPDTFARLFAGRRILVIAPHADDESYGCAGTILMAREARAEVFLIVVSVGDLVRVDGNNAPAVKGDARHAELEAVARYLDLTDFELLFNDSNIHMRVDTMPRLELTMLLESKARLSINRICPDLVLLPAISHNQDHEAVMRAGLIACRPHDPAAKAVPPMVLLYEYPPLSWLLPQERFIPNVYVDITQHLTRKLEACAIHSSQLRGGLHQNSLDNLERLARLRGRETGVEAAEAYQALRILL